MGNVPMLRSSRSALLVSLVASLAGAYAADEAPGLVGEYFAMDGGVGDFPKLAADRKPTLVRIDKQVSFDSGEGQFHGTKLTENFYARWTGTIHIDKAGEYGFTTESDDGSRLFIDDKPVVDNGGPHAFLKKSGKAELTAGDHAIRIDYFQGGGGSGCKAYWTAPGGSETVIPASALAHAKGAEERISWDKAAWSKMKGGGGGGGKAGGGWFYSMDFGPLIDDTITSAVAANNIAIKGHAVKLTAKGAGADAAPVVGGMCFDTDLMRMAFGWTGGFLELKGVAYDGAHGVNGPKTTGTQIFATPQGPGWAKGDSFADPRSEPFGALPHDWAHYTGHYINGDQVVFAYTVGTGAVLELPAFEAEGKALSRTMSLSGFAPSTMLVAELAGAKGAMENGLAVLTAGGEHVSVGLVGAPAGVTLAVADDRILLKVGAVKSGLFKIVISNADAAEAATVVKGASAITDPATLTKGGAPRYPQTIETVGELGTGDGAYVVDTITIPEDNPFKSKMRLAGHDFFSDGRAAVCTWNGDVWIVSGIDDKLAKLTWKRYATGLHQSLGLKIVDDLVYVQCREGLVRLHDLNKDGEADFYENFNNDIHTTPAFHEFAFDLWTDPKGNFYFAKAGPVRAGGRGWERISEHNGCMFKIAKDGSTMEVFATGFRAPNGMSISPDGQVTSGDNEGTWTPTSRINLVEQGGFYGVPDLAHRKEVPTEYDKPILWLPHGGVDNSCGGQAWVTSEKWGLPKGQLLHLSYGTCSLFAVAWSKEGGTPQGGAVRFPLSFNTGTMRARFNDHDGQLYITGLKGWQTSGAKDGGFQRVRYTGKPANMPVGMVVKKNGLSLTFSSPLDRASAAEKDNYSGEQWNYLWTGNYGSPEVHIDDPKKNGHDPVEITSVTLSADGKTVFLEMPKIQPVMQMKLKYKINAADGTTVQQDFYGTINKLGAANGP
jgi:hypothetical protein